MLHVVYFYWLARTIFDIFFTPNLFKFQVLNFGFGDNLLSQFNDASQVVIDSLHCMRIWALNCFWKEFSKTVYFLVYLADIIVVVCDNSFAVIGKLTLGFDFVLLNLKGREYVPVFLFKPFDLLF